MTIFDARPRGYRCTICNRPAARYDIKRWQVVIDVCDGCGWLILTQQWAKIGQRYLESGPAAADQPIPFPEPQPFPAT